MNPIGSKAPEFTLQSQDDQPVTLSELKGKKVVLYFYPKDNTPGCTREGIGFSEKKDAFAEKNTVVIGISKDSVKSHQNFCQKQNLSITLLSDPEGNVIESYGAWREKKNYGRTYMGIVRSTYVIDETGTIQHHWDNVRVNGHVDAVLDSLSS